MPVDFNITPRSSAAGIVGHVFVGRLLGELKRAYHQLREAHEALKRTQQQLLHSEKMASLGRPWPAWRTSSTTRSASCSATHALQRYTERLREYLAAAIHAQSRRRRAGEAARQLRIDHLLADLPSLMEGTLKARSAPPTSCRASSARRWTAASAARST